MPERGSHGEPAIKQNGNENTDFSWVFQKSEAKVSVNFILHESLRVTHSNSSNTRDS